MDDGPFFTRLVEIASREIGPKRVDEDRYAILQLIADIHGQANTAVLLWLKDCSQAAAELRLAYCCDAGENEKRPPSLCNLALPLGDQNAIADDFESPQSVRAWFAARHGEPTGRTLHKLVHSEKNDEIELGVIEVLTNARPHLPETLIAQRMNVAAAALAAKIRIGRSVRPMDAVRELQTRVSGLTSVNQIVELAAKVLRVHTSAKLALVYRPATDDTDRQLAAVACAFDGKSECLPPLRKFAPTSRSLTFFAFGQQATLRLDDLHHPERTTIFGGRYPDPPLLERLDSVLAPAKAWLSAPVTVAAQDGVTNIASLVLLNKKMWRYLYSAFTDADEAIARAIAEYLAAVLPGLEAMDAMEAIGKRLTDDSFHHTDHGAVARAVLDALKCWVPGIAAVAFAFDEHQHDEITLHASPPEWGETLSRFREHTGLSEAGNNRWVLASPLGGNIAGRLLVGLNCGRIPTYQVALIERGAGEAARLAFETQAYEQALVRLIEIRHAIRSGIQGVIGHVGEALAEYRLAARDRDPRTIQQEMLDSDGYQVSLETGLMAAHQISVLMDEARYAFSDIRFDTLQLGSHDLPNLVAEVVRIVKPEAEHRDLNVRIINRLSDNARIAIFDRKAVLILIYNLIDNAIKYAYRGTEIAIILWVKNGQWRLAVRDHGVYIRSCHFEAIFKPFRRAVSDPSRPGASTRPGTGLGLAVCQRIVQAHSRYARLDLESVMEPRGDRAQTIFYVTMPFHPKGDNQ